MLSLAAVPAQSVNCTVQSSWDQDFMEEYFFLFELFKYLCHALLMFILPPTHKISRDKKM
jgi:hypothetical protein